MTLDFEVLKKVKKRPQNIEPAELSTADGFFVFARFCDDEIRVLLFSVL